MRRKWKQQSPGRAFLDPAVRAEIDQADAHFVRTELPTERHTIMDRLWSSVDAYDPGMVELVYGTPGVARGRRRFPGHAGARAMLVESDVAQTGPGSLAAARSRRVAASLLVAVLAGLVTLLASWGLVIAAWVVAALCGGLTAGIDLVLAQARRRAYRRWLGATKPEAAPGLNPKWGVTALAFAFVPNMLAAHGFGEKPGTTLAAAAFLPMFVFALRDMRRRLAGEAASAERGAGGEAGGRPLSGDERDRRER